MKSWLILIDLFENIFEYRSMAPLTRSKNFHGATRRVNGLSIVPEIRDLRSKIEQLEKAELGSRALPTYPGLGRLLPTGGLQRGSSYTVKDSTTLAMAMLAGPSASGAWCAVLGLPEFGVEAATQLGIDLERLVLVPHPGEQWLNVAAALVDVVGVLLLRAPGPIAASQSARLSARMRQRGCVVVSTGNWPQAEAELRLSAERWDGLGEGHGVLNRRAITVSAHWRNGQNRQGELRIAGTNKASSASTSSRQLIEQLELQTAVNA